MILPNRDTFISNGADSPPNLYWINDYANALRNNMGEFDFQALGVKPIRVDDKIIKRTLKPSVVVVAAPVGTGLPSIMKKSPWMSTNSSSISSPTWSANTTIHHGAKWLITNTITPPVNYTVQVKATYQFRRPLLATPIGPGQPE